LLRDSVVLAEWASEIASVKPYREDCSARMIVIEWFLLYRIDCRTGE
jgi:hypothetical protein